MKPPVKEITHLELLKLGLAKAGGARELRRRAGVARATSYRLLNGVTDRLQAPTVDKLWAFLNGK